MIWESVFGIVSGLGGSVITGLLNHRQQKLQHKHELAMIKAERESMIAEAEANIKVAEIDLQRDLQLAEMDNFKTSQIMGNKTNISNEILKVLLEGRISRYFGMLLAFLLGLVDVVRSLMRPAITIILLWITTYMTYKNVVVVLDHTNLITIEYVADLMEAIIYLTFTVIGWWFGDRGFLKLNIFRK